MENIIGIITTAFTALAAGYILRLVYAKLNARSAEQTSKKIVEEMRLIAETKSKGIILDARLAIDRERKEFEHKIKERRQSVQNMENRLNQREENLDRRIDTIDKKEKDLSGREKDFSSKERLLSVKFSEVDKIEEEKKKMLEKISGMTREEAKKILMSEIEGDAK